MSNLGITASILFYVLVVILHFVVGCGDSGKQRVVIDNCVVIHVKGEFKEYCDGDDSDSSDDRRGRK